MCVDKMDNSASISKTNELPSSKKPLKKASTQLLHSSLGEAAGFAVSLGAVYFADCLLPGPTSRATKRVAQALSRWRHTETAQEIACARKIIDVSLMNIGGLTNMGTQFTLHRYGINPEERAPLAQDLGRLLTGRLVGTATSIGALAFTQKHMSSAISTGEKGISDALAGGAAGDRFAELLISNIIQSIGALPGSVSAQLLYDRVMGKHHSNQPNR